MNHQLEWGKGEFPVIKLCCCYNETWRELLLYRGATFPGKKKTPGSQNRSIQSKVRFCIKFSRFLEKMWGWVFFPINHVKDKQSVSLFLLEISVVFQEPAFLLSNTFTDFSNTLIPFLCRTYSITGHTNTLLIPRGWIQAWRKSVRVPGDQQRDISLHWATIWPILSDVFGQQLRSSWLLYISTKGVEKSFWYGYLVK